MSNLKSEFNSVLTKLTPLVRKPEPVSEANMPDAGKALEILTKLKPLLRAKDTTSIKLIEGIRGFPGTEELVKSIEGYKFKQASDLLESIEGKLMNDE